MSTVTNPGSETIIYPDSDGKPMAENDLQYRWIVTIRENLGVLFRDRPDVYIAADHLIYPVEGNPKIRQAPDTYVAFGRPKGDRGSYKVWLEGGIFPQVVFEIMSPGNRPGEMARKLVFYERYGAEEYYVYDPDRHTLQGYIRDANGRFAEVAAIHGHVSPRLGIRFDMSGPELVITDPDGKPFRTYEEVLVDARNTELLREEARRERQRADQANQRADNAERELERVRQLLRQAGVDPDRPGT